MALWIKAKHDSRGSKVETVSPMRGETFSQSELKQFVGSELLHHLPMNDGHFMWISLKPSLPINLIASTIAHDETGIPLTEFINGDVLIADALESGMEKAFEAGNGQ